MTAKFDTNTKYIVLDSFIKMWKSAFFKNKYAYIFLSNSVSVIKFNFMIASLVYIFSDQELVTNNLDVTYSIKYHNGIWIMWGINERAHCIKWEETC